MKVIHVASNCVEVQLNKGQVLFSYETPVAISLDEEVLGFEVGVYRTAEKFSNTTSKHINKWTATRHSLPQAEIERLANNLSWKSFTKTTCSPKSSFSKPRLLAKALVRLPLVKSSTATRNSWHFIKSHQSHSYEPQWSSCASQIHQGRQGRGDLQQSFRQMPAWTILSQNSRCAESICKEILTFYKNSFTLSIMKAFIVLLRKGYIIERHIVAATSADAARNVAVNRFGGVVLNVLVG
jgi:hypothetical protein